MCLTIKEKMKRPHLFTSAAIVPLKVAMRKGLAHRRKSRSRRHSASEIRMGMDLFLGVPLTRST
jgi:hypothetical protein